MHHHVIDVQSFINVKETSIQGYCHYEEAMIEDELFIDDIFVTEPY